MPKAPKTKGTAPKIKPKASKAMPKASKTVPKVTEKPPSFPQFGKLPPELRMLVWKCSLPSFEPGIYPFRTGLWDTRTIDYTDPRFNRMNTNVEMYFHHERLRSGTCVKVPTLVVNQESHAVARAWLRDQHPKVFRERDRATETCDDPKNWTFKRLFDPELDTVYVAPENFIDLLGEEENRTMDDDLIDIDPLPSGWNFRTAFDYNTLMDTEVAFDDLISGFRHDIENIFIIMRNSPGSVDAVSSGWWDLEPAPWTQEYLYYDIDKARIRVKCNFTITKNQKNTREEIHTRCEMIENLRNSLEHLGYTLADRFEHMREWLERRNAGRTRKGGLLSKSGCVKHYVFRPCYGVRR
ncbi:hypothetical protein E8E14_003914 [Neopestalotiopsis sp. 37M]|nr:hypothetical protein E8E14_003914 [Neopestalotiopsis sp. 37M]